MKLWPNDHRDRWCVGFILLLAAVVFFPFWCHGRVFVPGDILDFAYPWKKTLKAPADLVYNLELLDAAILFYPQDVFYNQELHNGILPLWNPHIFLGHPLLGSGQSGLLYPFRVLFHLCFSPAVASTLLLALHLPLAGLGFYLWLRGRGFKSAASVLGAVSFMFNAQNATWFEMQHETLMTAWVGFELWLVDRAVEREGNSARRCWAALALLWAMQLLAGHLQYALYFSILIGLYGLFRAAPRRRLAPFLGVVAMAALLSSPAWVPFLELLSLSQRNPLEASVPLWSLLLTMICPDAFGNPTRHFLLNRSPNNYVFPEFSNFVGLIPLILALSTLTGARPSEPEKRDRGTERFCWALVLVGLMMASAQLPYVWLTVLLPPLKLLVPGRALLLIPPALGYLAAQGCQRLEQHGASTRLRRCLALWVLLTLGVWCVWAAYGLSLQDRLPTWRTFSTRQVWGDLGAGPGPSPPAIKIPPTDEDTAVVLEMFRAATIGNPQCYFPFLLGLVLLVSAYVSPRRGAIGFLVVASSLDLCYFLCRFNTTVDPASLPPPSASLTTLRQALKPSRGMFRVEGLQAMPANTGVPYGLTLVGGYESLYPRRIYRFAQLCQQEAVNMRFLAFKHFDSRLLEAVSLKFVLVAPPIQEALPAPWEPFYSGDALLYRNEKALPRARWVPLARFAKDPEEALAQLQDPALDLSRTVIVEGAPATVADPDEGISAQVELRSETPHDLFIECQSAVPGYLVLADSYYPGWQCSVDGQNSRIYAANGCCRAVRLPAGSHQVRFHFAPRGFLVALVMAGLGLVGLLLWASRSPSRAANR